MFNYRLFLLLILSCPVLASGSGLRSALAADVYIKADENETGQGIFRPRGKECLVLTPTHVVENALKIEVTAADKGRYTAELVESFPGDISVLRLQQGEALTCRQTVPVNEISLETLLETEKQGELRTMLADGSIRIIPVDIVGFDKYRSIHVTPQDKSMVLAKGESGSPLYIGGRFSGMLLTVKNNVGSVMRRDALTYTVSLFFNDAFKNTTRTQAPKPAEPERTPAPAKPAAASEQEYSGVIANSAVAEHKIKFEGNSPVRLSFLATGDNERFAVEILDSARRVVFQTKNREISGTESVSLPFTPPTSDTYSLFILGTRGEGKYAFKIAPITSNAQLRGEANKIAVGGGEVRGILAQGAVAEYQVQLEGNSPVRMLLPATGDQLRYSLDVVDAAGKSVYKGARQAHSMTQPVQLPFTPPRDGLYSLRIKGVEGEGNYALELQPIAANAQLRGEGNLIAIGEGTVEGLVAQGAVAEYRLNLEAMHPVRLQFNATGDRGLYAVELFDSTGTGVYLNPTRRYSGAETFTIPITVLKKDQYCLRITGIEGECRYSLNVQPGR